MSDQGKPSEDVIRPPRQAWRLRWTPLGRDIAVILVVKLAALALLWWAFFSDPLARHMTIEAPRVGAHLVPSANPEELPRAVR
jgi:hypothetical protein